MASTPNKKMLRPGRSKFSYAESESSNSPTGKSDGSSFDDPPESSKTSVKFNDNTDSEDELHSEDVIHGTLQVFDSEGR